MDTNIFKMGRKAMKFYPESKNMRRQWVEKTLWLYNREQHVLYKEEKNV